MIRTAKATKAGFNNLTELVRQAREREALPPMEPTAAPGTLASGGFDNHELPDITASALPAYKGSGYGLLMHAEESDPGVRIRVFTGTGHWDMAPGDYFFGTYFEELRFEVAPSSTSSGAARFLVLKSQDLEIGHFGDLASPAASLATVGADSATTQAANSTANDPVNELDGVAVSGHRKARIWVSAENAQTLSGGGSVCIWSLSTPIGLWGRTSIEFGVPSGQHTAMVGEVELEPGWPGRLHPEARSVTVSAGLTLTVRVELL